MSKRNYKPEEIVAKPRQLDILYSQGMTIADAIRQISVSEATFYRWCKECGGIKAEQLKCLKELKKENERLRRSVSDLILLDKQILVEAAKGNFCPLSADGVALILYVIVLKYRSAVHVAFLDSTARHNVAFPKGVQMKIGLPPI